MAGCCGAAGVAAGAGAAGAALVIGMAGYGAVLALAVVLAARAVGPGFLWPGYVLVGATVMVACCAFGHGFGALTRSRTVAPPLAGASTLLLLMFAQDRYTVGLVSPDQAVSRSALASRILLALALAIVVAAALLPGIRNSLSNGYRPSAAVVLLAVLTMLGVLGSSAVTWRQPLLTARDPVAPLCTDGSALRICIWPEQRRFLPELTVMAGRIGALQQPQLQVPSTVFEQGLQPASGPTEGLFLAGGNVWMTSLGLGEEILISTFGSRWCVQPATQAQVSQAADELAYWLAMRISGGPQPADVFGGPQIDRAATAQVIASPAADQRRWAAQRLDLLGSVRCG